MYESLKPIHRTYTEHHLGIQSYLTQLIKGAIVVVHALRQRSLLRCLLSLEGLAGSFWERRDAVAHGTAAIKKELKPFTAAVQMGPVSAAGL